MTFYEQVALFLSTAFGAGVVVRIFVEVYSGLWHFFVSMADSV